MWAAVTWQASTVGMSGFFFSSGRRHTSFDCDWSSDVCSSDLNDGHTAFAPLFLRTWWAREPLFRATRTVLTIHNIGYQGIFAAERIADLGLAPAARELLHPGDLAGGRINALRHGILYADLITTVSPTHAREICSAEYGMGLEDSLRARGAAVSGILNGVDYEEWDPRRDRYLPRHYDAGSLAVKGELKRQFAAREKLTTAPEVPLAGIVSRLAVRSEERRVGKECRSR